MSTTKCLACRAQGLENITDEPLLLSVLRTYMAHPDAAASPTIAAKSKSSITAKPGGVLQGRIAGGMVIQG